MSENKTTSNFPRLKAVVSGNVQGVAFRYFTQLKAKELGVTGWCANMIDRTVVVVAEGEKAQLEAFFAWLHDGSPSSVVKGVAVDWSVGTGEFKNFKIKRI